MIFMADYGNGFLVDPPTTLNDNLYATSYLRRKYSYGNGTIIIIPLVPLGTDPTTYGRE